jgi:diguanylate cyclase (GGDEF)-like protein/PAS domain S-box-containing protein
MKQLKQVSQLKSVNFNTQRANSIQNGESWLVSAHDSNGSSSERSYAAAGLPLLFKEYGYIFVSGSEKYKEFFAALDESDDSVAIFTAKGEFKWVNNAWTDQFGFSMQEIELQSLLSIVLPEYHEIAQKKIQDSVHSFTSGILKTKITPIVIRCRNGFGEQHSLECIFHAYWCDGEITLIALMRDITYHQGLVARLRQLERQYNVLTETVNEAIIRIDEDFNIVFANSAVKRTFGFTKAELLNENFSMLFPPEIFKRHESEFRKYFIVDDEHRGEVGLKRSIEVLGKHKSRGVSPMEMSFGNSSDFQGRTLTCIIRDITQRKNIERQLRKLAYHDRLTNLGNRDLFNNDMKEVLDQLEKFPMLRGALMFLDLDGFKNINDTLGHKVGDELLLKTAGRLRECLRESDAIYRFGGDEFVIMLPQIESKKDAVIVARKILAAIRSPYYLHAKKSAEETSMVTIGVSIGIALFPAHGKDTQTLIQNADLAMYESKSSGKNCFTVYHKSLVSKATLQLKIEQGLKNALHDNLFELYYQPLVDLEGKTKGVEALLRWNDRELGQIAPAQFIPVAEEKGMIVPLGNWVLERACQDMAQIEAQYGRGLYVSINVSPVQLREKKFVSTVVKIINRSGIPPHLVNLEITEFSLMRNPEETIQKLLKLKETLPGLSIVIDDFGTGYSSLSYLSKLPADSLKVDISFVAKINEQHNQKIVGTMVHLAESLDLEVVVEGIETKQQWEYFRGIHCSTLQGYHFSRPVPLDEFLKELG